MLDNVVGFFVNTVLLHIEIVPQSSYLDIIQQVKKKFLDAFENRYLPTQEIISLIRKNIPSFTVEDIPCSFNSTTFPLSSSDNMEYTILNLEPLSPKTDIVMWINEFSNKISINCEYDARKLDSEKMNQFMENYIELLKELEHPNTLIYSNILFKKNIFIENQLNEKTIKDIYPLTNIQQDMYLEGEVSYRGNYQIGSFMFLDSLTDVDVLKNVVAYIFKNIFIHNIRIITYHNKVYQYILENGDYKKNILRLDLKEEHDLENEIFVLSKKSINLKKDSLLKVVLIYKENIPYAISWISHHVVLDALSVVNLNIFTKKAYDTFIKKGVFLNFKTATIYDNFQETIKEDVIEKSDFWENALSLAETPPLFNKNKLGMLEKHDLFLKKEDVLELRKIQREHKVSMFSIFIGCYVSLLHKIYNFENNIVIYEPSTTRKSLKKISLGVYVKIIPIVIEKEWFENNNLIELIKI